MLIVALMVFSLAFCAAAQAQIVTGTPRVVDGDTLRFPEFGDKVRLLGIDAPETGQSCRTAAGDGYPCGLQAAEALKRRIDSGPVRCEGQGRGRYGRLIAVCFAAGGTDLNGWMVAQGQALAYRRYSKRYVTQERAARNAGRGIWRGRFVKPWRWRHGERLPRQRR